MLTKTVLGDEGIRGSRLFCTTKGTVLQVRGVSTQRSVKKLGEVFALTMKNLRVGLGICVDYSLKSSDLSSG